MSRSCQGISWTRAVGRSVNYLGHPTCPDVRDYPAAYGPRATVYNRLNRWSRCGFRRAMLTRLAKAGWAGNAAVLNSGYGRAFHLTNGCGKGARTQVIGTSRNGQTTKIHVLTGVFGRQDVLLLTLSNAHGATIGRGFGPNLSPKRRQGLRLGLATHRHTLERHHARLPEQPRPRTSGPP